MLEANKKKRKNKSMQAGQQIKRMPQNIVVNMTAFEFKKFLIQI